MKAILAPPPMTTGVRRPSDNVMTALGRLTRRLFRRSVLWVRLLPQLLGHQVAL